MRMLDPVDRWVPIWYQPIGMQNSPMNERDITSATRLHLLNLQFPIRPVLLNAEGQVDFLLCQEKTIYQRDHYMTFNCHL